MGFGNNELGSRSLYGSRNIYQNLFNSNNPEYVDLRGKRLFYGKVDYDFDAVMLRNKSFLKNFKQKKIISALNFVVDAFEDMKTYIRTCETRLPGFALEPEDFIKDMKVKKGWENLNESYSELISVYDSIFHADYVRKHGLDKKITGLDDYVRHFMDFYNHINGASPLTRSGYVLSRFAPHNSSGLLLEIDDLDHSNDQDKVDKYYNNRHFGFYVKTARKFGFLIDKNAPWRLVANFGSPNMLKYLEKYDTSPELLFEKYFAKTHLTDSETLKRYMIYYYNNYVDRTPITETLVGPSGKLLCKKGVVIRKRADFEYYMNLPEAQRAQHTQKHNFAFTDDYWYPQYYYLRMFEAGRKVDKHKFARESRKIATLKKYVDFQEALRYINEETKTTFRNSVITAGPETPIQKFPPPVADPGRHIPQQGITPPNIRRVVIDAINSALEEAERQQY